MPRMLVAEEHQRQNGQARDQEVAREGQHHVDPAAHHGGFARILAGEHALHIVVRRRAGRADQHALEQQHHDEEAEQPVAVFGDLGVGRGNQRGPVQVQVPAEEDVVPAGGNELAQRAGATFIMAMMPTAKEATRECRTA